MTYIELKWKKKKIIHFLFLYFFLDVKKRPANEKCEVAAIGAEITEVSFPITKIHTGIFLYDIKLKVSVKKHEV